jgi:hypothetical protein
VVEEAGLRIRRREGDDEDGEKATLGGQVWAEDGKKERKERQGKREERKSSSSRREREGVGPQLSKAEEVKMVKNRSPEDHFPQPLSKPMSLMTWVSLSLNIGSPFDEEALNLPGTLVTA